MKFLIDECLSPDLAGPAIAAGYVESAFLGHRGMLGQPDHVVMREVLANDWTLVTRNADDFRPRPGRAARSPCYVGVPLHAGLVCLNMPALSRKSVQLAYFRAALDSLARNADLTNEVLEVWPDETGPGAVLVQRYGFPEA